MSVCVTAAQYVPVLNEREMNAVCVLWKRVCVLYWSSVCVCLCVVYKGCITVCCCTCAQLARACECLSLVRIV